jgi:hypothetical protein
MTSHVVAKVVTIDTTAAAPCMPASGKKRKRWSPLKKRRATIAVLSDGDEVMAFLDCAMHEVALKQAVQSGGNVLLTHVITGIVNDDKLDENIVLRPTESTTVSPMLNDGMISNKRANPDSSTQQCISLTQDMPGAFTRTLTSPLRDVYIDELGISLGDGKRFVSPNGFVSTLIDTSGSQPHYRAATITLDGIIVKADAKIIQTLCGSIDAVTLLSHSRLKRHVTDLMRGFLEEHVDITWTIEQQSDVHHVQRCYLPRL